MLFYRLWRYGAHQCPLNVHWAQWSKRVTLAHGAPQSTYARLCASLSRTSQRELTSNVLTRCSPNFPDTTWAQVLLDPQATWELEGSNSVHALPTDL